MLQNSVYFPTYVKYRILQLSTVILAARSSFYLKGKWIYIAPLLYGLTLNTLMYGSHSFTCKLHHICLYLVSVHQMAPPLTDVVDI